MHERWLDVSLVPIPRCADTGIEAEAVGQHERILDMSGVSIPQNNEGVESNINQDHVFTIL